MPKEANVANPNKSPVVGIQADRIEENVTCSAGKWMSGVWLM